jgi:hypothetical protein
MCQVELDIFLSRGYDVCIHLLSEKVLRSHNEFITMRNGRKGETHKEDYNVRSGKSH